MSRQINVNSLIHIKVKNDKTKTNGAVSIKLQLLKQEKNVTI